MTSSLVTQFSSLSFREHFQCLLTIGAINMDVCLTEIKAGSFMDLRPQISRNPLEQLAASSCLVSLNRRLMPVFPALVHFPFLRVSLLLCVCSKRDPLRIHSCHSLQEPPSDSKR